jgi:hypothetical protein
VAKQCQDVDGGRAELGDESVGEGEGHPARGRTGPVGLDTRRVDDGAPGLLAVEGVSEVRRAAASSLIGPCRVSLTPSMDRWRRRRANPHLRSSSDSVGATVMG